MKKQQYHLLLRQQRLSLGLTQSQIAERIGEPQSYVSKYESGEQRLDLYEVESICTALNMSLLDFVKVYNESE